MTLKRVKVKVKCQAMTKNYCIIKGYYSLVPLNIHLSRPSAWLFLKSPCVVWRDTKNSYRKSLLVTIFGIFLDRNLEQSLSEVSLDVSLTPISLDIWVAAASKSLSLYRDVHCIYTISSMHLSLLCSHVLKEDNSVICVRNICSLNAWRSWWSSI